MNQTVTEIAESPKRLSAGELDKLFIEYYLESASPKEAYVRACKAGGHDFKKEYAAQYGQAMYKRLVDKIDKAVTEVDLDDDVLGRSVQRQIAKSSEAPVNIRLAAATALRRKKPDTIIMDKPKTPEQVEALLKKNKEKIRELKG